MNICPAPLHSAKLRLHSKNLMTELYRVTHAYQQAEIQVAAVGTVAL